MTMNILKVLVYNAKLLTRIVHTICIFNLLSVYCMFMFLWVGFLLLVVWYMDPMIVVLKGGNKGTMRVFFDHHFE